MKVDGDHVLQGVTPLLEASRVYKRIARSQAPDDKDATMWRLKHKKTLGNAGEVIKLMLALGARPGLMGMPKVEIGGAGYNHFYYLCEFFIHYIIYSFIYSCLIITVKLHIFSVLLPPHHFY